MTKENNPVVYLIPGQGADYRLFNNLNIDTTFSVRHIRYETPEKGTTMRAYAAQLAQQIDTTERFILIGTSLGGMLATEMNSFLSPEKTIIISSAKSYSELPGRYKFQRKIPLYKLLPNWLAKSGALIMQPLVEPDRNKEKDIFVSMLKDKDPKFLKRTISMIIEWDRKVYSKDIIHIHGNKDKTIPIRNVSFQYEVEKGSHMMTLTRGTEISSIINQILTE